MFDSHCHLHNEDTLPRARAAGVSGFMLAGVEPEGWKVEQQLADKNPDVFCSFGLHPQIVAEWTDAQCDDAIAAIPPCIAIGEIGLDAFTPERRATLARQERIFRAQLAIARERNVPVILHILRTHEEALRVLKADTLPKAGGVVHSYSGSVDLIRPYLALGLHIALSGTVTYKNAVKAPAVAKALPLDRLLVETDSPDQTPEAHRPGPNEPAFLRDVVEAIALVRGESFERVARETELNARRLFNV